MHKPPRSIPVPDLATFVVLAEPPRSEEHCWAGAPSATVAPDGTIWCTYRLRDVERRGYEVRLARLVDGPALETVRSIRAETLGLQSLERAALVSTRVGFDLLLSYQRERWEIGRAAPFERPEELDLAMLRPADELCFSGLRGVKDPLVAEVAGRPSLFYTGYRGHQEQTFVATLVDGAWKPLRREPVLVNAGWHQLFTRPSCVLSLDDGSAVLAYEGCQGTEHGAIYNLAVGIADIDASLAAIDLTPDRPLLTSATPGRYHTVRYLQPVRWRDELHFLYEAGRPDDAFELRLSPARTVQLPR